MSNSIGISRVPKRDVRSLGHSFRAVGVDDPNDTYFTGKLLDGGWISGPRSPIDVTGGSTLQNVFIHVYI